MGKQTRKLLACWGAVSRMSVKETVQEIEKHLKTGDSDRAYHIIYNAPVDFAVQVLAYMLFRLIVALTKTKPKETPSARD